jgi:hypothetical protein
VLTKGKILSKNFVRMFDHDGVLVTCGSLTDAGGVRWKGSEGSDAAYLGGKLVYDFGYGLLQKPAHGVSQPHIGP